MAKYFYDNQIRRFLIQFARIFSNWNVTKGQDPAGNDIIVRVPIQYGDSSRMVSAIQSNNSPSSLPSAPLIVYYISGLEYDQKRTQDPYFVDKLSVRQRAYNPVTQQYEQTQGQAFTVQRVMPVPYTLRITVDFWTTNYQQKLQLIEQLGVLFNPSMEIQSTDNFIDWTSLSVVYQDGLTFSSRTIPVGTANPIDIMTWKFYMPIWISNSAKITKMGVIHKIIASIFQGNALTDMKDDDLLLGTRQKITPYGYKVLLIGNTLQILPANEAFYPSNQSLDLPDSPNTDVYWKAVMGVYGTVREGSANTFTQGVSQIWLQNPHMDTEIVGSVTYNPTDDRLLIFNIDPDTLPQNTLDAVNSVINPLLKGPSLRLLTTRPGLPHDYDKYDLNNYEIIPGANGLIDKGLPEPGTGANSTRYLIVEGIGSSDNKPEENSVWGDVVANSNDIIECVGFKVVKLPDGTYVKEGVWQVVFDSQNHLDVQFVTNITTQVQYRFADGVWMKSYEGWYDEGDYSIVI